MQNKHFTSFSGTATIMVLLICCAIVPTYADTPSSPHNANAMWVEPESISVTPSMVGQLFNVTVWLNMTQDIYGWQTRMHFNKTILQVDNAGYTADTTSMYFLGHSVTTAIWINNTAGTVQVYEICKSFTDFIAGPRNDSLFWAEFIILSVPANINADLNISREYGITREAYTWVVASDGVTYLGFDHYDSIVIPEFSTILLIRADGSIDPSTAPISTADNVTYVLNGSIHSPIVVERNDTVVDGAGYTVQGTGDYGLYPFGICLTGRNNVTVKNVTITGCLYGILIDSSSNISVIGNSIGGYCRYGVYVNCSISKNSIIGNTITINDEDIYVNSSSNCIINGNYIEPSFGDGIILEDSSDNIISGNYMSGYYVIKFESSSNNSVDGNNITAGNTNFQSLYGVYLSDSSNNSIIANNISGTRYYEVYVASSTGNRISGNNIDGSDDYSLFLNFSSDNTISGNVISENYLYGVVLDASSNNDIIGNNITSLKSYSIILAFSSDANDIFHNNFLNDSLPVLSLNSINNWDDGTRGNYWSNYNGTDKNHDGIGDTPYIIDSNNQDNYPLMGASHGVSEAPIWSSPLVVGVIAAAIAVAVSLSFLIFRRKKSSDSGSSGTTLPKNLPQH